MITIYVDYRGARSIETDRFKNFDKCYLQKLSEIEQYKSIIDSVKIFRYIPQEPRHKDDLPKIHQQTLVNTTNAELALRKARFLATSLA